MKTPLSWTNFYRHPRFYRHVIAWAVVLGFFIGSLYLAMETQPEMAEQLEEGIYMLLRFAGFSFILIYATVFFYDRLIPKKKYWQFAGITVLAIIAVSAGDALFGPGAVHLGSQRGFLPNLTGYPISLIFAFTVKLAYGAIAKSFSTQKLKTQQVESELKLLRSQVNPHFLFNTLNNIYATNLEDHEKANEIILELADLLRYQLESDKKDRIPLEEELNILENYINLEKIRVRNCEVIVEKKGDFARYQIPPLLLLPFVENAFKYGTGIGEGKIEILIEMWEKGVFRFICTNRIVQQKGRVHSGGIGLANVKKRLELLYPNNHRLDLLEEDGKYVVKMGLKLDI